MKLKCNECGKVFKVSSKNMDPECPNCGGVDVEPDADSIFSLFSPERKAKRKVIARNYSVGPFDLAEVL